MTDSFVGGKLKLKGVKDGKVKKKNKKKKLDRDTVLVNELGEVQSESNEAQNSETGSGSAKKPGMKRTNAEKAFMKTQLKREGEKILKKAQTSHKDRVENFNEHLDNLIEHFDIPKVSWTK